MSNNIVFKGRDVDGVEVPTNDPMVISAMIGLAHIRKVLVDCRSSVNIIFKHSYDQMKMEAKDLKPCKTCIHGFNGASTELVGYVELLLELGSGDCTRVWMLPFIVLDVNSPYNAFVG